jgi:hypothetical protein
LFIADIKRFCHRTKNRSSLLYRGVVIVAQYFDLFVLSTYQFYLNLISVVAPMDVADGDDDEAAALEAALAMSMGGAAAVPAPCKSQFRSVPTSKVVI